MPSLTVSIHKLQKHLFHYIRLARKGTHILICKSQRKRNPVCVMVSCDSYSQATVVDVKTLVKAHQKGALNEAPDQAAK
jgi:hypothetical protein